MKKIHVLLIILMAGALQLSAQPRYMVNIMNPVESYAYKAYKYNGPSSQRIAMSGGLQWYGGFTIGHSVGPYKAGYAVFDLGGSYDKLMFVLGHQDYYDGSGGSGVDTSPKVFTVHVDGRKVLDKVIYAYSLPERITLDVKGAHEVKFILVQGYGRIGVAEATLWKSGEKPVETGNIIKGKAETTEFVSQLRPYFKNRQIAMVSPEDNLKKIKVNGREYGCGMVADMTMALIGSNPGWAYFNLRGQYSLVSMVIGPVDNTEGKYGSGWITIKGDGKILKELEVRYDDVAQRITLDVTGCDMFSIHTEQASGSTKMGFVEMKAYPPGEGPEDEDGYGSTVDPRLKKLPDVCKLISNIPPYVAGSLVNKQIYDGSSDHITFSMGGVRFSEGLILFEKASVLSDNTSAYAAFDLGNEFDYVSFTAGYIGKSKAMNNDVLYVYADDKLVLEAPLVATAPNKKYVVPINKCRTLKFYNKGSATLDVAAYGLADMVVYRGEPVENDLFVHPRPECPPEIDLIDLGAPYIHYVSPMEGKPIFYDGSTMRNYFEVGDKRINKGFLLQTSVHFSLDHGVLSGTDGAAASVIGGAAVGSAFVAGGMAVGGALVGSTLIGAAAFLMLAAGGEAIENSCAAFNTYGEYNSVTFTVACANPYLSADNYKETLLIGADQKVVAQIGIYETMEPQTITVPIDGCEQLMFWLANTDNWSGAFVFYDIKLTKERLPLNVPKPARLSLPNVRRPVVDVEEPAIAWERPSGIGGPLGSYFSSVSRVREQLVSFIKASEPTYQVVTYYLETDAGQVCRAVMLSPDENTNLLSGISVIGKLRDCMTFLERVDRLRNEINEVSFDSANAAIELVGIEGIKYGKLYKQSIKVLRECKPIADELYRQKYAEAEFLNRVLSTAVDIDGKQSAENCIFCPLAPGETAPDGMLQLVRYF